MAVQRIPGLLLSLLLVVSDDHCGTACPVAEPRGPEAMSLRCGDVSIGSGSAGLPHAHLEASTAAGHEAAPNDGLRAGTAGKVRPLGVMMMALGMWYAAWAMPYLTAVWSGR